MSPLTGLSKRQLIIPGLFRAGPHCGGPDGPCLARPLYVSKFVEATTKGFGYPRKPLASLAEMRLRIDYPSQSSPIGPGGRGLGQSLCVPSLELEALRLHLPFSRSCGRRVSVGRQTR
jgi:hypothetical protein